MRLALLMLFILPSLATGDDYISASEHQANASSRDVRVRLQAVIGFGKLAYDDPVLEDGSMQDVVRMMAMTALEKALSDGDERVRLAAAKSLQRWGWLANSQSIESKLEYRKKNDPSAKVREVAAEALHWIRYNATAGPEPPPLPTLARSEVRKLQQHLQSTKAVVRYQALARLGARALHSDAAPIYLQATFDADASVRDAAMQQLWQGDRAAADAAALSYAIRRMLTDSHVAELIQRVGRNGNRPLGLQMLKRIEFSGRLQRPMNAKLRNAFIDAATRLRYRVLPETLVALTNRIETDNRLREPAFDAIAKLAERTQLVDDYVHRLGERFLPGTQRRTIAQLGGAAVGVAATQSTPLILRTLAAHSINPQADPNATLALARRLISIKPYRPACEQLLLRFVSTSRDDRRSLRAVSLRMKYEQRPITRKALNRLHEFYLFRTLSLRVRELMQRQNDLRKKTRRLQFERTFGKATSR